jgi:hypothetical protein
MIPGWPVEHPRPARLPPAALLVASLMVLGSALLILPLLLLRIPEIGLINTYDQPWMVNPADTEVPPPAATAAGSEEEPDGEPDEPPQPRTAESSGSASPEPPRPRQEPGLEAEAEASSAQPVLPPTTTQPAVPAGTDTIERSGPQRRRRVEQFGGTVGTETAVELGLRWLADHQQPDGTWDRFAFHHRCPPGDRCDGMATRRTDHDLTPGITGLCLLAFLGAGYTDREGPYPATVERAVGALLRMQTASGGFLPADSMAGYNDSLATFALAEYYSLTRDPQVQEPLQRAVDRLCLSQQPQGGWDYERRTDTGRNDTSITGWAVQALRAAAVAGIRVPPRTLVRAALHLTRATQPDGSVRYSDAGVGTALDARGRLTYRYGPAMAAVGLTCGQLLGQRPDSPVTRRQEALLLADLPTVGRARGGDRDDLHNEYYWYYGTVAMFLLGEESWQRWNAQLRDAILPLQDRSTTGDGRRRHSFGSWPPFGEHWGRWGRMGGRLYSTAISVLTLEIYYRHTPAYLEAPTPLTAGDWQAYLREATARERRLAAQTLVNWRLEIGEPVLVSLLEDGDPGVALPAALGLVELGSPLGLSVLERESVSAPAGQRPVIEAALKRAQMLRGLPPAKGVVRLYDAGRRLATLEMNRSFAGQRVSVLRFGAPIARMRVLHRVSGGPQVVAEAMEVSAEAVPESGDRVLSE